MKSSIPFSSGFGLISPPGEQLINNVDRILSLKSIKLEGLKPEPVIYETLSGNPGDIFAGKYDPVLSIEGVDISAEMLSDAAGVGNVRYPANASRYFQAFAMLLYEVSYIIDFVNFINSAIPNPNAEPGLYSFIKYFGVTSYFRFDAVTGLTIPIRVDDLILPPYPVLPSGQAFVLINLIDRNLGSSENSLDQAERQGTCNILVAGDAYRENTNMLYIGYSRGAALKELNFDFAQHELMIHNPEFSLLNGGWESRWIKTTNSRG